MGDVVSDTLVELEMLIKHYLELKSRDPEHELLKCGELDSDEQGIKFTSKYVDGFVEETDQHSIQGYMRFNTALKDALDSL